ncbi:MAG: global cell cycle regulator GcrA-like protein [Proteobacteria bacterium]|nr:global cell cycle regulator GcrA-like protein [Pseudomonadota bacterium]
MSWNTQKIDSLKKLWDDGVATSQIGQQLGFTKNAVIGKAFRLGLERRQNSRKKTASSHISSTIYRETTTSQDIVSNDFIKTPTPKKKDKFQFKKSIIGKGNFNKCQWPIGDPLKEGFHFCGDQNIATKPYCIEHYKQAYNVDEKYLDRLLDFLDTKTRN